MSWVCAVHEWPQIVVFQANQIISEGPDVGLCASALSTLVLLHASLCRVLWFEGTSGVWDLPKGMSSVRESEVDVSLPVLHIQML